MNGPTRDDDLEPEDDFVLGDLEFGDEAEGDGPAADDGFLDELDEDPPVEPEDDDFLADEPEGGALDAELEAEADPFDDSDEFVLDVDFEAEDAGELGAVLGEDFVVDFELDADAFTPDAEGAVDDEGVDEQGAEDVDLDAEDILFEATDRQDVEGFANPGPQFAEEAETAWSGESMDHVLPAGSDDEYEEDAVEEVELTGTDGEAFDDVVRDVETDDELEVEQVAGGSEIREYALAGSKGAEDEVELDDEDDGVFELLHEGDVEDESFDDAGEVDDEAYLDEADLLDEDAREVATDADDFEDAELDGEPIDLERLDSEQLVPEYGEATPFLADGDGEESSVDAEVGDDEEVPAYSLRDPSPMAETDDVEEPTEVEEPQPAGAQYFHDQNVGEDPEDWYQEVEPPVEHGLSEEEIDATYAPVQVDADPAGFDEDEDEDDAYGEAAAAAADETAVVEDDEYVEPDYAEYEENYVDAHESDQAEVVGVVRRGVFGRVVRFAASFAALLMFGAALAVLLFPEFVGFAPPRPVIDRVAIARPDLEVAVPAPVLARELVEAPPTGVDPEVGVDPTDPVAVVEPPVDPNPAGVPDGPVDSDPTEAEVPGNTQVAAGGEEPRNGEEQPVGGEPVAPLTADGAPTQEPGTDVETDPTPVDPVAVGPAPNRPPVPVQTTPDVPATADENVRAPVDPLALARPERARPNGAETTRPAETAPLREPERVGESLAIGEKVERDVTRIPEAYRSLRPGSPAFAQLHNEAFFVGAVRRIEADRVTLSLQEGGEVTFVYADLRTLTPLSSANLDEVTLARQGFVKLENDNKLTGSILRPTRDDQIVLSTPDSKVIVPRSQVSEFGRLVQNGVKVVEDLDDEWLREQVRRRVLGPGASQPETPASPEPPFGR
jgi:hypothetical protein